MYYICIYTSVRILYIYTRPLATDWLLTARIIRYVFGRFSMKNVLDMEKRLLAQIPVARCSSFVAGFVMQACAQRN